jgi:hypothetical protein
MEKMENKTKEPKKATELGCQIEAVVSCIRATQIVKGCVVIMSGESGMKGYGNPQSVSKVCEPLGELSLYGHNQHYKIHHVLKVIEYPLIECKIPQKNNLQ